MKLDWLTEIDIQKTKEIAAKGMQPGWFVNLTSEFGDVWHEVKDVFDGSCTVYSNVDSRSDNVKAEYTRFSSIRKVAPKLPEYIGSLFCKDGAFSDRRNNLNKIPKYYF